MEKSLTSAERPHLTIRPSSGWSALNIREVLQFRDLMMVLAVRDIKLRYRQTALGAIWVVLQPLMSAGVLAFVFGTIAKLKPSAEIPPFLFTYTGMLGWNAFSSTIGKTGNSLVGSAHLVSKVYFPRLVIPLASLFGTLLDFSVALMILPVLLIVFHIWPGIALLTLPIWLALILLLGMGIGLCVSALMVSYRDVGQAVGFVIGLSMYVTPVAYAVKDVPHSIRGLYGANPVAGLLEAFRWSLLGRGDVSWAHVAYGGVVAILLFVGGAYSFKRMERRFADVI